MHIYWLLISIDILQYPNATPETQQMMTTRVLTEMYSYWERQAIIDAADHRPGQVPGQDQNIE